MSNWFQRTATHSHESEPTKSGHGKMLSKQDLDEIVGDRYKTDHKHKAKHEDKGTVEVLPTPEIGAAKIGGGGLSEILESIVPLLKGLVPDGDDKGLTDDAKIIGGPKGDHDHHNPFEDLTDADFDDSDPVVEDFKGNGGTNGVMKIIRINAPEVAAHHIAALASRLRSLRSAHRQAELRAIYSAAKSASEGIRTASHQVEASSRLRALLKDSRGAETPELLRIREAVLAGTPEHLDAAAFRVKAAYARYESTGVRTAFTIVENDFTRGYNEDHYSNWFERFGDTTEAVFARIDTQRNPDNAKNLLTLASGERSKPLTDAEKTYEERFEDAKLFKHDNEPDKYDDKGFEAQLADVPKGSNRQQGEKGETRPQDIFKSEKDAKYQGADDKAAPVIEPGKDARRLSSVGKDCIDPDSSKTLGEQIDKGNKPEADDASIEKLLAQAREDNDTAWSDDELETLIEQLLADDRKND